MNRQSAVFRISIYSIIILLLLSILIVGLAFQSFSFRIDSDRNYTTQTSFHASEISDLEIEWAAGSICIVTGETDTISVEETGADDDGHKMAVQQNGKTLSISYQQPSIHLGITSTSGKDLTITVPEGWICREMSIDAAAVRIQADNVNIDTLELDLAAADCRFENCILSTVDIDAASGNIYISGVLDKLDCDAASAKVTAVLENVPHSIDFDSASGDLDLTLPENAGFTAEVDSMSGNFSSDFNTTHQGARHISGDGTCRITVDGMSGDVTIRKAK